LVGLKASAEKDASALKDGAAAAKAAGRAARNDVKALQEKYGANMVSEVFSAIDFNPELFRLIQEEGERAEDPEGSPPLQEAPTESEYLEGEEDLTSDELVESEGSCEESDWVPDQDGCMSVDSLNCLRPTPFTTG
jgi:hypothetical protein